MRIKFLGTAAAEAFPSPFCVCEKCVRARALGGKNLRSRSQAVIDDKLLLDFPADTVMHTLRYGLELTKVNHCLITHVHADHWSPEDLVYLQKPYSHVPEGWEGFTIYGSVDLQPKLEKLLADGAKNLTGIPVEPFVPFEVCGYTVVALKADHGTAHPYVYSICDGKKSILYAHDTDIFPEETWTYLRNSGLRFDLISLDCNEGAMEALDYRGHGCLGQNLRFRTMLKAAGVADDRTVFVTNHFSHNGKDACYDDFAPLAEAHGFLTSYDGMELEI